MADWDVSNLSSEKIVKKKKNKKRLNYNMDENLSDEKPKKKRTRQRVKKPERVTNVPVTVKMSKLNKEFYEDRKWPAGVVRYFIEDNGKYDIADVQQRLNAVNNILRKRTCVRLRELSEDEVDKYKDYIVINDSPDYVTGRVGGRQNFGTKELLVGGQHRQHAAMMVMAMLGFYFEVARHDRDKYIRVHARHIRPDKLHHFEKIRSEATFPLPFDYKSATFPAWQFWRHVGKTGISTVATYKDQDPDASTMRSLGQNEDLLSEYDIIKINTVYGVKCFRKSRNRRE